MNRMDTKTVQALLEKYFDGSTSVEEEKALFAYFSEGESDPSLESYRLQFQLMANNREPVHANPDFEARLSDMILSLDEKPYRYHLRYRLVRYAVAASIALLVGITGYMFMQKEWHREKDTYQDPQVAYAEVQKTLLYVSQKMNQGMKPLNAVNKMNTAVRPLKSLNKMDHSLDYLNHFSIINQSSNLKK